MASETELTSDSEEGNNTQLSDQHMEYLKEKIIQHIIETDIVSAEIKREPGKPAKLVMTFGSKPGMYLCVNLIRLCVLICIWSEIKTDIQFYSII